MTCILAVKTPEEIHMMGDRSAVKGDYVMVDSAPKICRIGPALIGFAGDFAAFQAIKYNLKWIWGTSVITDSNIYSKFCKEIVPVFRSILESHNIDLSEDEDTSFLIGVWGALVEISGNYQVNISKDDYAAIGAGEEAIIALDAVKGLPPEKLECSMNSVLKYKPGVVSPPFDYFKVKTYYV